MRFFKVLKKRKILFLNIFLFLYIAVNLFTGDRGLMSFFEKREIKKDLASKKIILTKEISEIEHKNLLLSDKLDFDFDLTITCIVSLNTFAIGSSIFCGNLL